MLPDVIVYLFALTAAIALCCLIHLIRDMGYEARNEKEINEWLDQGRG